MVSVALSSNNVLHSSTLTVQGRSASYGHVGHGPPLVFCHGLGANERTYKDCLVLTAALGFSVFAPSLPGFGKTPDLPVASRSLRGYSAWLGDFVQAVGIGQPIVILGQSLGGGIAMQFTHDYPRFIRHAVTINGVGGRSLKSLSLSRYGMNLWSDLLAETELLVHIRTELFNGLSRPGLMSRMALLAYAADLSAELVKIRADRTPVDVWWSRGDRIVPAPVHFATCSLLGVPGTVVDGHHSWPVTHPYQFAAQLERLGLGRLDTPVSPSAEMLGRSLTDG